AFEVWGTDQVEARYLLHPVMMERLLELETKLHGKRLRCAFEDGDCLVAVEGGNLFEPGDLFKPLVDPARARRIVNEISGVFGVLLVELTPGPNMGSLAALSASQGRTAGFRAVAGVTLGLAFYMLLAVLGVAEILAAAPLVYGALRWAGVAYLLYLAWEAWR